MVFSCCRSRISFSNPQDAYIAYLAGERKGRSPIAKGDRKNAFSAQPHPLSNKCRALISQILPAISFTGFLFTAYLLSDIKNLKSIVGEDICSPCDATQLEFLDRQQGASLWNYTAPFLNRAFNSTIEMFNQAANTSFESDYLTIKPFVDNCEKGESLAMAGCGLTNYADSFIRTASEKPFLLAASFGLIFGWKALEHLENSHSRETASEQKVIDNLQIKFQDMAERLRTRSFNLGVEEGEKVKELALKIIERQDSINKKIVDLGIPSVSTVKKAHQITQPLFAAARAVADLQLTATQEEPQSPKSEPKASAADKKPEAESKTIIIEEIDDKEPTAKVEPARDQKAAAELKTPIIKPEVPSMEDVAAAFIDDVDDSDVEKTINA